jgi:hypothetical protein
MIHPYDLEKDFQDLVSGSKQLELVLRRAFSTDSKSEGERERDQVAAAVLTVDIVVGILKKIRELRTSIDRLEESVRILRS